ncbi:hypothetical protein [Bacillus sp. TL12]|nr:hypothetical protein [Bacillus sp. TL12]MCI0768510.1 hypothetical protein [Bacillus sp. TL12]
MKKWKEVVKFDFSEKTNFINTFQDYQTLLQRYISGVFTQKWGWAKKPI